MKRRREQLEREHRESVKDLLTDAAEKEAMEESIRPVLSRELSTKYHDLTSSWMHPFSNVRKDAIGFFIYHKDNPDAWRMQSGDLIQDVSLNMIPLWEITGNDHKKNRVSIKPIGQNPFLTGVGAGGAKITERDIKVFTGEYEEDRVASILKALNSGKINDVSNVAYILLGTVGLRFGPNGPQGGVYAPNDTMCNRGGLKGMSAEEIVSADATTLSELGFIISQEVIEGNVDVYEWQKFVGGSVNYFGDWDETPPADTEIYKQKMMEDYKRRGALDDEWRRETLVSELNAWDEAIKIWVMNDGLDLEGLNKYNYSYLASILGIEHSYAFKIENKLKNLYKWQVFTTEIEDPSDISNAVLLLNHPQADIQMRAVERCLMHIASSNDEYVNICYSELLQFLDRGKGQWLVNEKIILYFTHIEPNPQPLIIATNLPDGVNRQYAYWGLTKLRDPYINQAVFKEKDPQGLNAIVGAFVYHGYMPRRHETYYLKEILIQLMYSDETTYDKYYINSALGSLYPLLRKQGLEWEDAYEAVMWYDKNIRSNPLDDKEWIEITLQHMHRIIGRQEQLR